MKVRAKTGKKRNIKYLSIVKTQKTHKNQSDDGNKTEQLYYRGEELKGTRRHTMIESWSTRLFRNW